jgi:hypothetical protein
MKFTQDQLDLILKALEYYQQDMELDDFDSFEEFEQAEEELQNIINLI